MDICPLCNGLEEYVATCDFCGKQLIDQGRVTDFLDNYSAYMDINLLKQVDGELESVKNHTCIHLVLCTGCQAEHIISVKE
ncbi:hypothetical protein [Sutcliffiella rhizosphaerae]|uniref:Uncharacterized protein n=1 Tax=Sutcliffiella rhizosphaerae TaxID=2880967 RepID=A0ABN8ABL3_9BACI|nr:hypothetical protein [Sutcliffiella rhizosphaerae]CAG9622574.1 hypothetical protein BACCIP111883_03365 [Sutcliffiella rhizosphaerae]